MGMPITMEVVGDEEIIDEIFSYLRAIDQKFSTYKDESEISRINGGKISLSESSREMQEVFALAEQTKQETQGYFDIRRSNGSYDPSGLVKGWAIHKAAGLVRKKYMLNFYIEAGGDIEVSGKNS